MGGGGGVEVGAAFAVVVGEDHVGVGAARHLHDALDVAVEPHVLVEVHFLPVGDAHADGVGVLAAEINPRIAHGLEAQARHGFAVGEKNFELGVGERTGAGGEGFEDELLAAFGLEGEEIGVGSGARVGGWGGGARGEEAAVDGAGDGEELGLCGRVVGLGFDEFGGVGDEEFGRAARADRGGERELGFAGRGGGDADGGRGEIVAGEGDFDFFVCAGADREEAGDDGAHRG